MRPRRFSFSGFGAVLYLWGNTENLESSLSGFLYVKIISQNHMTVNLIVTLSQNLVKKSIFLSFSEPELFIQFNCQPIYNQDSGMLGKFFKFLELLD